jgi:hypothetical protein
MKPVGCGSLSGDFFERFQSDLKARLFYRGEKAREPYAKAER